MDQLAEKSKDVDSLPAIENLNIQNSLGPDQDSEELQTTDQLENPKDSEESKTTDQTENPKDSEESKTTGQSEKNQKINELKEKLKAYHLYEEDGVLWALEVQGEKKDKPILKTKLRKRTVLLVGEGDFSFADIYATSHSNSDDLIASELEFGIRTDSIARIECLLDKGVIIAFGLDATKLDKYKVFENKFMRFQKIQFNCPWAGETQGHDRVQRLVQQFANSAKSVLHQTEGTLNISMQDPTKTQSKKTSKWFKAQFGLIRENMPGYSLVEVNRDFEQLTNAPKNLQAGQKYVANYGPSPMRITEYVFKIEKGAIHFDIPLVRIFKEKPNPNVQE